jgi:hypothetical protein
VKREKKRAKDMARRVKSRHIPEFESWVKQGFSEASKMPSKDHNDS